MKKLIAISDQNTEAIKPSAPKMNDRPVMDMIGSGNEMDQSQRFPTSPKQRCPAITTPCLIEQQGAAAKFALGGVYLWANP